MGFYFHIDTGKVLIQYEWLKGKGYLGELPDAATVFVPASAVGWLEHEYGGYYLVVGYRVTPMIQPTFKMDKLDPDKDRGGDNLTDFYYGLNLNVDRNARFQVFYRDSERGGDFVSKGWRAQVSARF